MTSRKFLMLVILALLLSGSALAQRNLAPALDQLREIDAKHNLDVAKQGFGPARKAYKQVLERFEETFAVYPEFSGIDEFLYLAGMSSYYLSENKGNQKFDLKSPKQKEKYDPAKLRNEAIAYLSLIVDKYPDSQFLADAKSTLAELKPEK